ncbi:NCAN [Mytilus coruscus]|uniref:NCAN n=1 Tax=Mytilus coruscus TaxID=42192 RepID=A0A6J8BBX6_MYTCO|nr:NCAN [Mytilus coruscus]
MLNVYQFSHQTSGLPLHTLFENGEVLEISNMQESGTIACEAINEFRKDAASASVIVHHDGINGQPVISNVNGIITGINGIDGQETLTEPNEIFLINDINEGRVSSGSISQSCDGAFLGGFAIGRLIAPIPMADGTMMTTAQVMMMRLMSIMTGSPMAPMMCQPQPVSTPCPTMACPPPPPIKTAVCPPRWILFKEMCYTFSSDKKNWDDAKKKCEKENAILAEPDTTAKIDFLKILARIPDSKGRENYWIGGRDRNPPTDDYVWTSRGVRVKIGATDWAMGEPNDFRNRPENCIEMRGAFNHKWNDIQCSQRKKYICQKRFVIGTAIPLIVRANSNHYRIIHSLSYI